MIEKYADAYKIRDLGIPFEECKLEGITEYTQTDVYSVPSKYNHLIEQSLKAVGYTEAFGTLFTES